MRHNMGKADRLIRLLVAVVLTSLFFADVLNGIWGYLAIGISVIFAATSFIGFCPLYTLVGFNTCSVSDEES